MSVPPPYAPQVGLPHLRFRRLLPLKWGCPTWDFYSISVVETEAQLCQCTITTCLVSIHLLALLDITDTALQAH